MSVLKARRHLHSEQYVTTSVEIFTETFGFLEKLSNRYQRLLGPKTAELASEVMDHTEKASNMPLTSETSYNARLHHLLEARAAVMALDIHMSHIWRIMMTNPQGCFVNNKGEKKGPKQSMDILDKMAISLGSKIDIFVKLCEDRMSKDRKDFKQKQKKKEKQQQQDKKE